MMALRTTLTQGRVLRSVLNSQKPLVRSLACFSSSQIYSKEVTNVQNQFSSCRSFLSGPVGVSANRRPYSTPSLAEEVMKARVSSTEKEGSNKSSGDQGSGDQQQQEPPKGPKPLTKWQKIGYAAFGVLFTGGIVINAIVFSMADKDENGNVIEDEFSELPFFSQHFSRLKSRVFKTKKDLEEPFSDKLLPDPMTEPYYQPKYTILIELTGLLVHSNWTHKHGWRFQKRPGVDMFLSQVGYPNFELVIFTTENGMTFDPIVNGLDPELQHIMYRLYRDATRYVNGHHTKDLSAINRDLKKVILIDWNPNSVALNRQNALLLKKWEGDNTDRHLIGLAQLLQAIKQSDVEDVRDVLEYYRQFDDPIETFRENQRKLQEEMSSLEEKRLKEMQTKGSSFFSRFSNFGRKS